MTKWREIPSTDYEINYQGLVRRKHRSPTRSAGIYKLTTKLRDRCRSYRCYLSIGGKRKNCNLITLYESAFPEHDSSFFNDEWLEWSRAVSAQRSEEILGPRREIFKKGAHKMKRHRPQNRCRYCNKITTNMFCNDCFNSIPEEARNFMEVA